jgi:hypothetical protein
MENAAKKRIERVGFPDFWEQAFDEVPEGFIACSELIDLENKLFEKPLSEPLHKVIRHLAKISANSLSALTTLLLNGYGPDGMKVARGIFETSSTVEYLIKHPDELEDYFDFEAITAKRRLDWMDARYPELVHGEFLLMRRSAFGITHDNVPASDKVSTPLVWTPDS